jgi:cysteine synthase
MHSLDHDEISPPVVLEKLRTRRRTDVIVVRDDLLEGGTKQRALIPFLKKFIAEGRNEFVYASPFSGFAQIALAASCRRLGVRCRVFAAKDIATNEAHEFSRLAESFGAKLHLCDDLVEAEARSILHADSSRSAFKLPLGFNHADFRSHLKTQLAVQWTEICRSLGSAPSRVWLPVGSGTLLHTFRSLLAPTTEILGIGVNVLPEQDLRICSIRKLPNTSYATCPEAFETPARLPPPIPSNAFYDAKLWSWIEKSARPGDLWWNVAR